MQKTLWLINVRLDVAIRDTTGKSGLAVIDAILSWGRDPHYLASLVDIRMRKPKEEIAYSLQGSWRDELLFELGASLDFYRIYEKALQECDKVIEKALSKFAPVSTLLESEMEKPNKSKKKSIKNAPVLTSLLLPGTIQNRPVSRSRTSYSTVLCLLTTTGDDIHKLQSPRSFASWLQLVPNNKISGGRIISSRTPFGKSYLASALRQAASSIGNQKDHELTPFFKRIAYKNCRIMAITATARKLAVII